MKALSSLERAPVLIFVIMIYKGNGNGAGVPPRAGDANVFTGVMRCLYKFQLTRPHLLFFADRSSASIWPQRLSGECFSRRKQFQECMCADWDCTTKATSVQLPVCAGHASL